MRKIPVILTAIYLGLVLLSIIPIFTGDDPLSGVFAIILTAPWSLLLDDQLPGNLVTGLVAVADTHLQPIETAAAAPDFRDFLLQKHNLHSQLVFPIHLHGQWWGTLT
jgi:GAF domain-containing protein